MYSFHFSLTKVCDYFFSCSWLSVLLMMAYMGTVTVMLLNILVAQMSTTYSQAKKVARLEYDVDRILQLTRMERFPFLVSINQVMRPHFSSSTHRLVCLGLQAIA